MPHESHFVVPVPASSSQGIRSRLRRLFRADTLRTRLFLTYVLVLLAVQGAAYLVVREVLHHVAGREAARQTQVAENVSAVLMAQNRRQLEQLTAAVFGDGAFVSGLAEGDLTRLGEILRQHTDKVNASSAQLVLPNGQILAAVDGAAGLNATYAAQLVIDASNRRGRTSAVVLLEDGRPYRLVVVPVQAADSKVHAAISYVIDAAFARGLQEATQVDVTFVSFDERTRQSRLLASSLPDARAEALARSLQSVAQRGVPTRTTLYAGDDRYETSVLRVGERDGVAVLVLLQKRLAEVLEPLGFFDTLFVCFALASLAGFALASMSLGKRITQPVNELVDFADRVSTGDYAVEPPESPIGEIQGLAASLRRLRTRVAARETQLYNLAYRDSLTGLANRAQLLERLEFAIAISKRDRSQFALVAMDLDKFKTINDTLGHHAGDAVLREVGRRLSSVLREADTIARLGGDEFATLLLKSDTDGVRAVCDRIIGVLREPISVEGRIVEVGVSLGAALYPEHGDALDTLVRNADSALYAAKNGKVAFHLYDPARGPVHTRELTLLDDLRYAITARQFILHYQPKLELATGRLVALEGLVRWNHPIHGLISPVDFLPMAERARLTSEITKWVLAEAVRQIRAWSLKGLRVPVAVNVFMDDLAEDGFVATVLEALERTGVEASSLILELSENRFIEQPQATLSTIRALRERGVAFAMDDFGTGHSSLSFLQELGLAELKIDRQFIQNAATDPSSRAIAAAAVSLARGLGIRATAEGVSSEAEAQAVRELGFDYAQGYFFGRPTSADVIEHFGDGTSLTRSTVLGLIRRRG